jgi:hypothetical protein
LCVDVHDFALVERRRSGRDKQRRPEPG